MDSDTKFSSNRGKFLKPTTTTDDSSDFFAQLTTSDSSSYSEDETIYYKHGKNGKKSKKTAKKSKNCIQVDLADLEASLDLLVKNLDTHPDQIAKSDPVNTAYENVKLFISMFYGREEYPKIVEILKKYPRPASVTDGTIGAFLFGCLQDSYGDISNKFCSPLCLQGVLPNDDSSFCPYQVWMLTDTTFEPLSENSSDRAYIFSSSANPKFTPQQISLLKSQNVQMAQVLRTVDSKHTTIIPLSELDNLPVQVVAPQNQPVVIMQANNTSAVNASRAIAILIFLILIALAIWLIFKYVLPRR